MKKYFALLFIAILFFSSCAKTFHSTIVTKDFDKTLQPPPPDYSIEKNWAALPWRKDNSDSTPNGLVDMQSTAKADVFWIHPTSYTGKPDSIFSWNADVNDEKINRKTDNGTMLFQASVFNGAAKIYAPRYRQAHIYAFFTPNKKIKWKALQVAYLDVQKAFEFYLAHYNKGRPIIIASHSQGSLHAFWLLRDYFKNKPLMKQLVAAYVVGMPIPTDSMNFILPCNDSTQTNCYVSWYTFKNNFLPINYFEYQPALCTNPITWRNDETFASRKQNEGSVLFRFNKILKHRVDAHNKNGLLWIHKPKILAALFLRIKNYHVGDYNLFYCNIRRNAALRVNEFLKK